MTLTNCSRCRYLDRKPNHSGDVICAVAPHYASMWNRLNSLDKHTLNSIPVDTCRDFELLSSLEEKEITLSLTFGEWREFLPSAKNEFLLDTISKTDKNIEISISLTFSELTRIVFYPCSVDQLPASLRDIVIEKSISLTLENWQAIANSINLPKVLEALKEQGIEPEETQATWIEVDSSCIGAIGFDQSSSTLTIRFNSREIYEYSDVCSDIFQDFIDANSKGRFFNNYIKDEYSYSHIGFDHS